jgi:hypothetical protein
METISSRIWELLAIYGVRVIAGSLYRYRYPENVSETINFCLIDWISSRYMG